MNSCISLRKFGRCVFGSIGILGLLGGTHTPCALAKTFVIPHVLEKSGSIATSNYTFDTTLVLTYNGSLNGTDKGFADVQLFLYDEQTGKLMQGVSNTICGPCGFELSSQNRKVSIKLDDLISGPGGGFDSDMKLGFAVVVISGPGAEAVNLQGFVVNSHTGPFDVSVFGFDPHEPPPPSSGAPQIRRAFVLPHVLESSGRALSTSNAIDTVLYATYTGALTGMPDGTGATLDLYLYDQATGKAMVGGKGADVCNPCSFNLGTGAVGAQRKRTIDFDDLITAAGGFGGANLKQGYAIISVGGADPGGVDMESFVVNSHTGPYDVSVFASEPKEIRTNNSAATQRAFVIPHVLEKSGLVSTQTFTFDSILYATYSSGLAGLPDGQGARLDLYLYDDSGVVMRGAQGPICDPCSFGLGSGQPGTANPRKQSIRIDDLIMTLGGGFDTDTKSGFGVLVVGGSDPDGVELQGFVVNSHTSAFDLSVFGFDPQPIAAASRALSGPSDTGLEAKAFVLPHVLERSGTINNTQFTFDTTLYATYAGGLPGTVSSNGASVKLFLYDSASGMALMGASGAVCNPCSFDLSQSARKLSIRIDDLITSRAGGFGNQETRDAFGVAVLDGDAANVKMQGFVVNAHTGAFDLSVFGFEPQPLSSARMLPMPVQVIGGATGLNFLVPTVIGGHYVIESKAGLSDPAWAPSLNFDGDGTVQTVPVPGSGGSAQFFRVNGK